MAQEDASSLNRAQPFSSEKENDDSAGLGLGPAPFLQWSLN